MRLMLLPTASTPSDTSSNCVDFVRYVVQLRRLRQIRRPNASTPSDTSSNCVDFVRYVVQLAQLVHSLVLLRLDLDDLSATTWLNVLSDVDGSQTERLSCLKNTSYTDRCGLRASWCTIWSPLDGQPLELPLPGVMCSFIRRSRISRAAAFWTRWRRGHDVRLHPHFHCHW